MNSLKSVIIGAVAFILLAIFTWEWGFCRFYVEPDQMAILIARIGTPLPPGEILAKKGQMGIQEEVLGEGRHFRNPYEFDHQIMPVINIPPGKVGVITAKVGNELPQGEFLANDGQKGISRRVLGPGKYRLNPIGYEIQIEDAVAIPIGYVGLITSLSGTQAPQGAFAKPGEKGVRSDILQPGLYYVNPKEFQINVLEIGVNQVSLLGREGSAVITKAKIEGQNAAMEALQGNMLKQQQAKRRDYYQQMDADIQQRTANQPAAKRPTMQQRDTDSVHVLNEFVSFPSRDGFLISLDMTLEYELLPESIAWLYRSYGDLPAVVDKIIMPQILSITRNKGSEYRAKDFIVGEGREKFQNDMTEALSRTMAEKKIVTHNALIRHVDVPMQILDPIQKASIATEQNLTNIERQNTARKQAELNSNQSLIEQRRAQVAQETLKLKAEIAADQDKQVAEIQAGTVQQIALIDKDTAAVRANKTRTLGKAAADAMKLVESERARGSQMKTQAFGDPSAYSLYEFAGSLRHDLNINILHSGQGTLWTDLEKANLGELGGASLLNKK
ncbi:MAG: SPFH domain-containing protein [bacterium]